MLTLVLCLWDRDSGGRDATRHPPLLVNLSFAAMLVAGSPSTSAGSSEGEEVMAVVVEIERKVTERKGKGKTPNRRLQGKWFIWGYALDVIRG